MKHIRTSKYSKILASYLALQMLLMTVQPMNLFALTGGPSQPEFNSFTPIGTSDMVNLSSGDFNYNIPIMDVGGYPLNLAYKSGVTMDQEASWVGLGWNLNVGQINRQVRGIPDDFNGDELLYENNLKPNKTIGATVSINGAFSGADFPQGLGLANGLGVKYNNYTGWSASSTLGVSYELSKNVKIGMNMENSTDNGVSVSPKLSLNKKLFGAGKYSYNGASLGTTFNSRDGLTNLTITPSITKSIVGPALEKYAIGNNSNPLGVPSGTKSFSTPSYTPIKRNKLVNESIAANGALGFEFFFFEGQLELYVHASRQRLAEEEKHKTEKAFGFNFTDNATKHDILDFNRENDRVVSKNTNVLPVTNYTYDLYSIQGQGISGMYQPYRSQVGYVYDKYVKDKSRDGSLGVEVGGGNLFHLGVELKYSPSRSSTGVWNKRNDARKNFIQNNNNGKDYEKVFYKTIGELNVDNEYNLLEEQLGGEEPIKIGLTGDNFNKKTVENKYLKGTGEALSSTENFGSNSSQAQNNINRENRLLRSQAIQKITKKEAEKYYANYVENAPHINANAKDHHNVVTRILQPDGSTYVFGQPAYNTKKVETTFNASGNSNTGDATQELVAYSGNDNTPYNTKGQDHYFNRVTTPAYAHTYLLSEVLSSDYEDLTGDGPTDDDLGAYTKIHYTQPETYNWRVPFQSNTATSNKGLNTLQKDDMGNYIYGEKEILYVDKIETKTHVAIFDLNERNDGYGVTGENGGLSTNSKMYQINTISLYSKPEYEKLEQNPNLDIKPIKVAHFEYDYSLCKNTPNNANDNNLDANERNFEGDLGGKLTLKSVYFTYRGSNMGRYTPYVFNYSDVNPDYHIKGYNLWGNYKPAQGNANTYNAEPTTAEFPYVNQSNIEEENDNVTAWTLTSVNLPSGGKLDMSYEADTYGSVQDKGIMEMFKVRGVGSSPIETSSGFSNQLYGANGKMRYLYVELPNEASETSAEDFKAKYIGDLTDKPIFFKFMLNMVEGQDHAYDFVSGYLKIDATRTFGRFNKNGKEYGAIPVQFVKKNKEENEYDENKGEHPIAKAGWYFGRNYLNRLVYGQAEVQNFNVLDIAETIAGNLGTMFAVFQGPNTELKNKKCAQRFSNTKSWIRLKSPNNKLGGGLRVSKVEMFDEWDTMTGNTNNNLYNMSYGQEYDYTNEDGNTSGIATYEPQGSKENPFVQPFYDDVNDGKLLAPQDQNYTETPFGSSFFPSPTVTYGRVTVRNLDRGTYTNGATTLEVGNNGTGKVVNEFYTSKDFPTITKHTVIGETNEVNFPSTGVSILTSLFGLNIISKERLSMSQGFTVITNDMNGKTKSQKVFSESTIGDQLPISSVEYHYNVDNNGDLNNKVVTINNAGEVKERTIGVDYNVINDFRHSKSASETYGVDVNVATVILWFPILPPFPVWSVTAFPQLAFHDSELRTVTTTKVIHKTGFLVEKKAFDLGAEVTTINKAWDAETGQVLLTETANEYKDKYYNFSYPAYWHYKNMGAATKNLNLKLDINFVSNNTVNTANASLYLVNGDEVWLTEKNVKAWVTNIQGDNFQLIDQNGFYISPPTDNNDTLKVIRSGYRNLQSASMSSVTLMHNPIINNGNEVDPNTNTNTNTDTDNYTNISSSTFDATLWSTKRIINASAVKYKNLWASQCECRFPELYYDSSGNIDFTPGNGVTKEFNPYLYNMLGEWRANESYAFLTGRYTEDEVTETSNEENETFVNPRKSGFYNDFIAFYKPDGSGNWSIDTNNNNKWVSASEVTQYSPYGVELENKDALDRYSSAQYGYDYKFPEAVASNSEYREMGFDSFENTYDAENCHITGALGSNLENVDTTTHFSFRVGENNQLSNQESHTGRKSLKLYKLSDVGSNQSNKASLLKIINLSEECTSFSPLKNKKYIFSVWVKVDTPQQGTTPDAVMASQPLNYENVTTKIQFYRPNGAAYLSTPLVLSPKGDIIEGWQKITGDFNIPNDDFAATVEITLENNNQDYDAFFDDARMHPYNANMKSFVYDSENYRLLSELDENNYATFYEYDNEGGLVRVKKETERGIMTIQETRSGSVISNTSN